MEFNDQVHDEPFSGESAEIEKDSSKEEYSTHDPSDKKEEMLPENTDSASASPGEQEVTDLAGAEPAAEPASEPAAEPASEPTVKKVPRKRKPTARKKAAEEPVSVDSTEEPGKLKDAADEVPAPPKPESPDTPSITEFDYSTLTREDLINRLEILLENQNLQDLRSDVDHIKVNFYKKNKAEIEHKRKKFIEQGGNLEDFQVQPDMLEEKIKELLKKYREQKTEFNRNLEVEKQDNLNRKYEVIEKIKELVNRKESINKTFNEFRDLQREWRMIGLVPQQNLKDLWDTYNHHVEKFYDYIKINKELRDLDLKKNLELKMQLCERAEELLLETNVVNAFKSLQKYHDRWREIGPVPLEVRSEIWERFREATSKINRKHQEHFEELKKAQRKNLEQKALLCERAEDLSNLVLETHKQWDEKSKELMELQKVWKTIGFAPKKDNNKIYERFRKACDAFFSRKREFYAHSKEIQMNNLQLKTDLCVQAESLQDSTEWKKTSDDLINLQKKWKEIGPVPKKHSEAVWRRFRAACDHFFQKKSEYFQNIDQTYTQNLKEKKKLLKEVENMELSENVEENFKMLNEYQRKWSEIGFVPFKEKEALQEGFRKAINRHFDNLDITDRRKNLLKFRNKLNNMMQKPKSDIKISQERERYINRLQQLRSDIVLWENNIGFFAKSKNAESMIDEVQSKIDKAKETIKLLEQKIDMIDSMDADQRS
jgi:triphosphoribosyl-dephospho-CoA synthetase